MAGILDHQADIVCLSKEHSCDDIDITGYIDGIADIVA